MAELRIAALLRNGQAAARAGEKAAARRDFRAALALDPDNAAALLWLAWLSDDPRASLAYITRVLARDPENPQARAALRWARRRASSTPPRELPHPAPELRFRWRHVAAGAALVFLAAIVASALLWFPTPQAPVSAALAPTPSSTATATAAPTLTPTHIPSPTPTSTSTPTPAPTRTPTPLPSPTPNILPTAPPLPSPATLSPSSVHGSVHWIDVDLTNQRLSAYEGPLMVRTALVSTGLPYTPTPVGQFRIWTKLRYDDMSGPGYYLPNVPYVMYFYRGYGLHGTYWHRNFGHPMSHGCINLATPDAEWLFGWAEVGTLVNIHY